jgi:hypothetical protein
VLASGLHGPILPNWLRRAANPARISPHTTHQQHNRVSTQPGPKADISAFPARAVKAEEASQLGEKYAAYNSVFSKGKATMSMISFAFVRTSSLAARYFSRSIVLDLRNWLTFASNFRSISSRFTGFSGLPGR